MFWDLKKKEKFGCIKQGRSNAIAICGEFHLFYSYRCKHMQHLTTTRSN
jgi:hypothetical protein